MANLIDLGDSLTPASKKLFGVIKRECFAIEVCGVDESSGETLQPGILIQILPDYRGDQCHFKIRNFTNWHDKYKTVIYKCKKDDFIVVTGELWPYLLALKNDEGRVKLVQNVYNKEFNLDMLKLGSEIRIRGSSNTVEQYYEFRVIYNGVLKEIGTGYYIGLQLTNDRISLTSDLTYLSRYYKFEGTGIVTPIDWIMLNLYKEGECQSVSTIVNISIQETAPEGKEILMKETQLTNTENHVVQTPPTHPNETCAISKEQDESHEIESINNIGGSKKTKEKKNLPRGRHSLYEIDFDIDNWMKPKKIIETSATWKHLHKISSKASSSFEAEINFKSESVCDKQILPHDNNKTPVFCNSCLKLIKDTDVSTFELGEILPLKSKSEASNLNSISVGSLITDKSIEKCQNCSDRVDVHLAKCQHGFCYKCACTMITTQVSDPNKMFVICTTCHNTITDQDVTTYGGEKIFAQQKLKSEVTKIISTSVDQITHNDEPFECVTCKEQIPSKGGVTLVGCSHLFCLRCCKEFIGQHLSISKKVTCPICLMELAQFEVNKLTQFTIQDNSEPLKYEEICEDNKTQISSLRNGTFTVEPKSGPTHSTCSLCNQRLQQKTCLKMCGHEFCRPCIQQYIMIQKSKGVAPLCPKCHKQIEINQILVIQSLPPISYTDLQMNNDVQTPLLLNSNPFYCLGCDQKFDSECGIILKNCEHLFCRDCTLNFVLKQSKSKLIPYCPLCDTRISDEEVCALSSTYVKEQLFERPTETLKGNSILVDSAEISFECIMCNQSPDPISQIVLIKCQHHICPKCLHEQISAQMEWTKTPKCPFCQELIDKVQLVEFGFANKSSAADELEESSTCSLCNQQVQEKIGLKMCGHEFCRPCIQQCITVPNTNGVAPSCPKCYKQIEYNQILVIQSLSPISCTDVKMPIPLNSYPFDCLRCDQIIDSGCGIVLKNCEHLFCRDCTSHFILEQSKSNLVPYCPLCDTRISVEEVAALGSEVKAE